MSRLRKKLGQTADSACYIETVPNQGYRFAASVERSVRMCADASRDDTLAPFRAFIQGRSDLDTLKATKTYETVTSEQNGSLNWVVDELSTTLRLQATEVFRHPTVSYKEPTEAASANWR